MTRILFLGDISVEDLPAQYICSRIRSMVSNVDFVVVNLEGPICADNSCKEKGGVFNPPSVIRFLQDLRVNAAVLANNHMWDFGPAAVASTRKILEESGIGYVGVGNDLSEASQPFELRHGGNRIYIFAFGWDVIGCRTARVNREGVNPLTPKHLFATVRQLREYDRGSSVIFIMHWNYELELYPQPAHRQLAHDLIREGVDAIIGMHPHVAQGAEMVDSKPIVYSLGNWFFPPRQLGHFSLAFPSISSRELALELHIDGRQVRNTLFHWYHFDASTATLQYLVTEEWDGSILHKLTSYSNMAYAEYIKWFRRHRARRRLLPIYKDYRFTGRNKVKDTYVKLRQKIIEMLIRFQMKQRLKR